MQGFGNGKIDSAEPQPIFISMGRQIETVGLGTLEIGSLRDPVSPNARRSRARRRPAIVPLASFTLDKLDVTAVAVDTSVKVDTQPDTTSTTRVKFGTRNISPRRERKVTQPSIPAKTGQMAFENLFRSTCPRARPRNRLRRDGL